MPARVDSQLMRFFLVIFIGITACLSARASEYQLELVESVAIYSIPSLESKVMGRARAGMKLKAERRPQKGFYIVDVIHKGSVRRGYISISEAGFSKVKEVKVGLRSHYSLGVSGIFSMQSQGERTLETTPDTVYNITEFKGTTTFFRVFADIPIDGDWAGRVGIVMRETSMEGNAQLVGSMTVLKFLLEQSFIGAEGTLKKYVWSDYLWVGGTIEISKGTKVELKVLSGPNVDDSGIRKPFFTVLSGSVGYDFDLSKSMSGGWYMTPELRAGGVVTTDPITYVTEGILNLSYAF